MKRKDYIRLSKISLKARKKTTRSTVRGISFGLILLLPLLFIVIAFHLDLNKEVNKDASLRIFNISYTETATSESYVRSMLQEYSDDVFEIKGVENIIKYNQYSFKLHKNTYDYENDESIYSSRFSITLDGENFSLDKGLDSIDMKTSSDNYVGLQVIDTSVGNSIFTKSDSEVIGNKSPLIGGSVFSSESKEEIMVSSNFLIDNNLSMEDVLNKKITINYITEEGYDITDNKNSMNSEAYRPYANLPITILKDYKIVGIFDSNIYKSGPRLDSTGKESYFFEENRIYETYFWLTTDSIYDAMGKTYLPEYVKIEEDMDGYTNYRRGYYYSDTPVNMAKSARTTNSVFIPLGMGVSEGNDYEDRSVFNTLVEFESYSDANNAVGIVDSYYKKSSTSTEDISSSTEYMQNAFVNYRMFYNIFTYLCIVLAIFGGIVFFATLLNLYNTIHYSVQSRRNYLGMIRAIGMKGKEVTKLYFTEVFQIFKRSYIWTAIFGGGICIGISYLFKMIMSSEVAKVITIDLSLNPIYILVAFAGLLIVNTIIAISFSLIACNSVSKKPILEVLVENR